jgi:APA family basic amino acid/polyamine antiporter
MAGYIAGWMFLVAKSASAATAALGFAAYMTQGVGAVSEFISPVNLALLLVALITLLTAGGLRRSNTINTVIVMITLAALSGFVFSGVQFLAQSQTSSDLSFQILSDYGFHPSDLMHATALAFVAYAGYGRIATLGEEVVEPRRTIPRAIIATLAVSMLTYLSVVIVSVAAVGAKTFSTSGGLGQAPLEQVARYLEQPTIASLIAVGATLAMAGVLLNLVLGLSRVLLAMARRKEMPQSLSVLTPGGESPKRAVWVVGLGIAGLVSIGDIMTTWSLSAFCVLIYYGTTNLAALKMPEDQRLYPKWVSWAGLFGCLSLAFFIDMQTIIVGLGAILLAFMVRTIQTRVS